MGLDHSPNIVTDGLVFYLDAGNSRSYSGSGITVNSLIGGLGCTFVNGVGFTTTNNGSFVFDGTNDYISIGTQPMIDGYQLPVTLSGWFKISSYKLNTICGVYNGFANVYNFKYLRDVLSALVIAAYKSFSQTASTKLPPCQLPSLCIIMLATILMAVGSFTSHPFKNCSAAAKHFSCWVILSIV